MPDEVAGDHSEIPVARFEEVSNLLLVQLGLKMPAINVKLLCKVLVGARANEANRPNKPGMTRIIARLRDAALEISTALESPHVLSRLAAGDRSFLAKWPDCWTDMAHVHQAAEAALLTIPRERGARSATPKEISARATCALLVALLFELSGKKWPRPTSARTHAVAEALSLASDGPAWVGHAKNLASWRPYFREISGASLEYQLALRTFVVIRLGTKLQVEQA
jgi:hypothetical protein